MHFSARLTAYARCVEDAFLPVLIMTIDLPTCELARRVDVESPGASFLRTRAGAAPSGSPDAKNRPIYPEPTETLFPAEALMKAT